MTLKILPHGRLQEWVAEEQGYFAAEGLEYTFLPEGDYGVPVGQVSTGAFETFGAGRGGAGISCACHWATNTARADDRRWRRPATGAAWPFPVRSDRSRSPPDRLIIQRFGPERRRQRRHLVQTQAFQRYMQPVLHALQHPLGRLVQAVPGPPVRDHSDHRVHRQPPQHERQCLHRLAVGPLQIIDKDRHRARGQPVSHYLEQPRAHYE